MIKYMSGILLVFLAYSGTVSAEARLTSLSEAFGRITTENTAGAHAYTSQASMGVSFGNFRTRVPRMTSQIIKIDPPSLSYNEKGCGNIDVHFGGFSFISGDKVVQMIKTIGKSAKGYVANLAIKQLCPQCSAIIQDLQSLAQKASEFSIDSCNVAKFAVDKALDIGKTSTKTVRAGILGTCGDIQTANNGSSDLLSAADTVCNKFRDGLLTVDKYLADPETPAAAKADVIHLTGNSTWKMLQLMGIAPETDKTDDAAEIKARTAELYMTIVGTSILGTDGRQTIGSPMTDQTPAGSEVGRGAEATRDNAKTFYDFLMCGDYVAGPSVTLGVPYCSKLGVISNAKFLECDDKNGAGTPLGRSEGCLSVKVVGAREWLAHGGNRVLDMGFLIKTHAALKEVLELAENRKSLNSNLVTTGGSAAAFLSSSPLPLYKVVNLASVYPESAKALLQQYEEVIAYSYASAWVDHAVKELMTAGTGSGGFSVDLTKKDRQTLFAVPPELRSAITLGASRLKLADAESEYTAIGRLADLQQSFFMQVSGAEKKLVNDSAARNAMSSAAFGFGTGRSMLKSQVAAPWEKKATDNKY